MNWQSNPELVEYRKRLINRSFRLAGLDAVLPIFEEDKANIRVIRAGGEVICELCGLTYRKHPDYPWITDYPSNMPSEIELCDGAIVHL